MILLKTLKKKLNDGLLLELEGALFNPRCVMLAPIAIKPELCFQRLPKWNRAKSPEDFEVYELEMMEGLLIKKEHLPICLGSE